MRLILDTSKADEEWHLRSYSGQRRGWICVLNEHQGFITLTEQSRELGNFESYKQAQAALVEYGRKALAKQGQQLDGIDTWTYSKFLHSYTLERNGTPIAWVLQTDDGFSTDLGNGRVLGTYSTAEEAQRVAERQFETVFRFLFHVFLQLSLSHSLSLLSC